MASLFDKNRPEGKAQPPTPHELIEKEVAHLKKGSSTRHGKGTPATKITFGAVVLIGAFVWLYAMDPFIYAWYKGEAARTFLYLHNSGSAAEEQKLVASGMFSDEEVDVLKQRQGSFQDYYATPDAANRQAETIIHYLNEVRALHAGHSDELGTLNKVRYTIFIKLGIPVPMQWSFLNPTIQ